MLLKKKMKSFRAVIGHKNISLWLFKTSCKDKTLKCKTYDLELLKKLQKQVNPN